MTIKYLITHSGGFHADELLSSVVLMRLFPSAELMRTRDRSWVEPGPEKIIYDVGGLYNFDTRIFDHHQQLCPPRPDGQPFSSFGLIWKHFGKEYIKDLAVPTPDIEAIHKIFDTDFVLPIDLLDNGVLDPSVAGPLSYLTLPNLLGSLKPIYDDPSPTASDDAFFVALSIARNFVEATIRDFAGKARARKVVWEAIDKVGSSQILELPQGMPYLSTLNESDASQVLFVIYPRGADWTLNGIKLSNNTFDQRADLPVSWAGLTDTALEEATGIIGAKFCHNARFIAIAKTREAIWAMAKIALRSIQYEASILHSGQES
jgi:uncharacterized UPF0160 family protein